MIIFSQGGAIVRQTKRGIEMVGVDEESGVLLPKNRRKSSASTAGKSLFGLNFYRILMMLFLRFAFKSLMIKQSLSNDWLLRIKLWR